MDGVLSHLLLESMSKSTVSGWIIFGEISLIIASIAVVVGLYGENKADKWAPAPARVKFWHSIFVALVTLGVAGELLSDGDIFLFSHRLQTIQDIEVASLTKATEEAKERAAVAYQKAEEEKLERVRIEKAIIDELAQRDIKGEQVEAISSAIKGKIGIIYLYPLSDPEASRYVFAISETLKRGGADPRLILSGTKELPVFPDKFNVAVSLIGVTVYESGGMHEVVDLLVRAFGEAGIKLQGQWSEKNLPGVVDGKWVEDASIQSPAIFVGLRPPPFSQFPGYASPPELDEFLKKPSTALGAEVIARPLLTALLHIRRPPIGDRTTHFVLQTSRAFGVPPERP